MERGLNSLILTFLGLLRFRRSISPAHVIFWPPLVYVINE